MTKDCRVLISGHNDASDIESPARYHKKGDMHYVFFERMSDGVNEKFSLKFGRDSLSYKREGAVRTQIILIPGQISTSRFLTPYGEFEIGFDTTDFSFEETEAKIEIAAVYDMTLNGEPHEEGKIKISISEVKA